MNAVVAVWAIDFLPLKPYDKPFLLTFHFDLNTSLSSSIKFFFIPSEIVFRLLRAANSLYFHSWLMICLQKMSSIFTKRIKFSVVSPMFCVCVSMREMLSGDLFINLLLLSQVHIHFLLLFPFRSIWTWISWIRGHVFSTLIWKAFLSYYSKGKRMKGNLPQFDLSVMYFYFPPKIDVSLDRYSDTESLFWNRNTIKYSIVKFFQHLVLKHLRSVCTYLFWNRGVDVSQLYLAHGSTMFFFFLKF